MDEFWERERKKKKEEGERGKEDMRREKEF